MCINFYYVSSVYGPRPLKKRIIWLKLGKKLLMHVIHFLVNTRSEERYSHRVLTTSATYNIVCIYNFSTNTEHISSSSVLGENSLGGNFHYKEKWLPLRPQTCAPSGLKKYAKIAISRFRTSKQSLSRGARTPLGSPDQDATD